MNQYLKKMKNIIKILLIGLFIFNFAIAADQAKKPTRLSKISLSAQSPIVDDNYKWHKIGNIWNRCSNYSYMGDDSYTNRTPSGDYPGGSGNSYLYRGTLWLSAFVDGTFHSTQGDDHEFSALDSVHVDTSTNARSEEDTYTKYYDVTAPLASGTHFPLGLEVQERTYAWSASYAADFIIYEYTIKNVGIDTNGDGLPDTPRGLKDFYFTIRFDGDVSKLPQWDAESKYCNIDDHAMSNSQWDWIEKFADPADPNDNKSRMAGRDHGLTSADADSHMIIMFDGDNPSYTAENGQANDFGNMSADGKLQTPGFIGIKVLKSVPELKPSSFHVCQIYNDPTSDALTWSRMISSPIFEDIFSNPTTGLPYAYDFRGILTFGPLDSLPPGDSVVVTTALGIGCDFDSGGVYSLVKLVKSMKIAQFIVDVDYDIAALEPPSTPVVELQQKVEDNVTKGVFVKWDANSTTHPKFQGYVLSKGQKSSSGSVEWTTLATYTDTVGSATWPPPVDDDGKYCYIDEDIIKGLVYYYAVQAFTEEIPEPIGVIYTGKNANIISPANPVATQTLKNVKVVPNPYLGSASWNNRTPSDSFAWEHRLQFTNLPADATIQIFTLDGDYVAETKANSTVVVGEEVSPNAASVAEWDLMTRNNQEAAPGIYMYVVKSPTLGEIIGKFVIVR
ncbi:MAG: hypothetical protein PHW79_00100 [Candidatus Marinimicrobia bacterium]|nr:hypothetical protein [Candidatus Neomarinimicrobiota bacterium]